ncbi:MAG: hypothetical protein IT385_08115 [Deltaproteobacteria bacterium]|nr:hypothetical protein [Deltaproteobacteria bacterium]
MRLDDHRAFTAALRARLEARDDVLGLVALGSMAEVGELPDDRSDHDFFVVVEPHAAEGYRARVDWLPDPGAVALHFRETPHGQKVILASGHLLEYAVFTREELALARVNRYRVLVDKADVAERMAAVADATRARATREAPSDAWLVGLLLSEALVAALRDSRGEHLSGGQRRQQAMVHLLRLAARHVPRAADARLDDLDASRRVERAWPELAARLVRAERESGQAHVEAILDAAELTLAPRMPAFPREALAAVRRRVAEVYRTAAA